MKKVFVKIVNEDLTPFMGAITQPTLLIWGENDATTPLSDAKIMNKLIKDSGLVVLKGAGHYSFLDRYGDFMAAFKYFLNV